VLLTHRLEQKGLRVERQSRIPIKYDGIQFDEGFRADMIIEGKVLLELKSTEQTTNAHKKQVLTYLKLTGIKLGYLLNFGEALMKNGVHRILNGQLD
jgi:GxxExxY protein